MVIHAVTREAVERSIVSRHDFNPRQVQQFFQAAHVRAFRLKRFGGFGEKFVNPHFSFKIARAGWGVQLGTIPKGKTLKEKP
jgi:hypothetical protein